MIMSLETLVPRGRHLIAVGLLFCLAFAVVALNALRAVELVRHAGSAGWLPVSRADAVLVGPVRPGGPADGKLRSGDRVLSIDGRAVGTALEARVLLFQRPPGPYAAGVSREGRELRLMLVREPYGVSFVSFSLLAPVPIAALFLLTGLAVFLLKPYDKQALLLAASFALFACSGGDALLFASPPSTWQLVLLVAGQTLSLLFWPALLHFFLVFPEPSRLLARLPRLERWLYLPPLALLPLLAYASVLLLKDLPVGAALVERSDAANWLLRSLIVYPLVGLLALVANYRQAGRASRRRLRVVVAGTLAGFLPLLAVYVISFFFDWMERSLWLGRALMLLLLLSLPLVPLSYAYAIVRHQVIPIRLIVRRSLRYLLVARGFFVIEALVLLGVLGLVLTGSRAAFLDRLGERADIAATALASLLVIGLLTLVHRRVMPVIDRRFFREEYDAQTVMAGLGDAVRRVRTIDELLDVAAARVREALHPESLGVFLLDGATGHYACVLPREGGSALLRGDSSLVAALRRSPAPRVTEAGGLILPIVTKGDLLGILSLGPRLGDLPYSREDRRLLEAVAWQLAFAIENARLVRSLVEEERHRRELALASEVQRRLFPEQPPASGALDLAGLCYPAQGVGGDYYDFLDLGGGRVGLAVADVAGKGISAALLMSIVQASLRSQARSADSSLTELVASMNQLLYRSTARNSFASFFYARFDAEARRLTYVNAGHNPPLLARAASVAAPLAPLRRAEAHEGGLALEDVAPAAAQVEVLRSGGIVLGATEHASYLQESVRFAAGDVLVAYTDGVTEAWNPEGVEFGEDRLRDVVLGVRHLCAREIADRIVLSVREWCRDTPQADDLTLVVAKVRG